MDKKNLKDKYKELLEENKKFHFIREFQNRTKFPLKIKKVYFIPFLVVFILYGFIRLQASLIPIDRNYSTSYNLLKDDNIEADTLFFGSSIFFESVNPIMVDYIAHSKSYVVAADIAQFFEFYELDELYGFYEFMFLMVVYKFL